MRKLKESLEVEFVSSVCWFCIFVMELKFNININIRKSFKEWYRRIEGMEGIDCGKVIYIVLLFLNFKFLYVFLKFLLLFLVVFFIVLKGTMIVFRVFDVRRILIFMILMFLLIWIVLYLKVKMFVWLLFKIVIVVI